MNCKQARSLFSARVDGELTLGEERDLDRHLQGCPKGCSQQWASFQATVRAVRALPALEPDPSFVGQVLDRVRDYEARTSRAGAGRLLEAARRDATSAHSPLFAPSSSLAARLRDFFERLTPAVPVPVRFAGVGALGIAAGFLLASGAGWMPLEHALPGSGALGTRAPAAQADAAGGGSAVGSAVRAAQATRPFEDLVGELALDRHRGLSDDDALPGDATGRDSIREPGSEPGPDAGVLGDAPIRVVKQDGRPQITF